MLTVVVCVSFAVDHRRGPQRHSSFDLTSVSERYAAKAVIARNTRPTTTATALRGDIVIRGLAFCG